MFFSDLRELSGFLFRIGGQVFNAYRTFDLLAVFMTIAIARKVFKTLGWI